VKRFFLLFKYGDKRIKTVLTSKKKGPKASRSKFVEGNDAQTKDHIPF